MFRTFDPDSYGNPAAKGHHNRRFSNRSDGSRRAHDNPTNFTAQACDSALKPSMFTPASLSPSGLSTKTMSSNAPKRSDMNKIQSIGTTNNFPGKTESLEGQDIAPVQPTRATPRITMTSNNNSKGRLTMSTVSASHPSTVEPKRTRKQKLLAESALNTNLQSSEYTPDEMLKKAREQALRDISLRNRARDQTATTSLNDLGLARQADGTRGTHTLVSTFPRTSSNFESAFINSDRSSRAKVEDRTTICQWDNPGEPTHRPQSSHSIALDEGRVSAPTTAAVNHSENVNAFNSATDTHNTNQGVPMKQETVLRELKASQRISRGDLPPIKAELDALSNPWGSSISSDASQASGDSTQALHVGKLFPRKRTSVVELPLAGYDGKIQPPPIDWNDRPRFNNQTAEFQDSFSRWANDVYEVTEAQYNPVPIHVLRDPNSHPDGLGMVERLFTINESNATIYGYEDIEDTTKYASAINREDFQDWGKLDLTRPENLKFKDECTETLVRTWVANVEKRRAIEQTRAEIKQKAKDAKLIYKSEVNPNQPVLNIYLRPAVKTDIPQIASIYNHYIRNSPRTAELNPIADDEMLDRLEDSKSNKLPFIVAVMRNKKSMIMLHKGRGARGNDRPLRAIDPVHGSLKGIEKIVGWAVAQDMTASDYVERISVEMEIYVDPESRQHGVGRCLMDQILEVLDRGYVKKAGYPFHCAPELHVMYSPGGERDIHKILLVIRKYKFPVDGNGRPLKAGEPSCDKIKLHDCENDYDQWMKEWLESWGFQQEGLLSGIGAKGGRFLDAVYMARETMWQPTEGRIPNPLPGSV